MLIPLGIWASSGGAEITYELISTQILGANAANITFSSIPQTYKHLQVRMSVRTNRSGYSDDLLTIRFNGDTATNYSSHYLVGEGSSGLSSSYGLNESYITRGLRVAGGSFQANAYTPLIVDLLDYASTSKNKTTKALCGYSASGTYSISLSSGHWRNTSAVTEISIGAVLTASSLVSGTRISLYGIKG